MTMKSPLHGIPGSSSFLWIYDELAARLPSGARVVEVGVALGHSIAHLGKRASRLGLELWAVDSWVGRARNGEQQQIADRAPGGDFGLFCSAMLAHAPDVLARLHVLRTDSLTAARMLAPIGPFDVVLLDAGHTQRDVADDLAAWLPLVAAGGILAGDDFDEGQFPGLCRAVRDRFGEAFEVRERTWVVRRPNG